MRASRQPLSLRLVARLYWALLALYPGGFRDAYAWEMVEVFHRGSLGRRSRSAGAVLHFWLRAFGEVSGSALRLRGEQAVSRNRSPTAPAVQTFKPRRQTMSTILHDVRFAARTPRRPPAITLRRPPWRSGSAPKPRSSASSTGCSSTRCPRPRRSG